MRCTAADFGRLAELAANLSGEGLYWAPALRILVAARPDILNTRPPSPVLRYIDVNGSGAIRFEEMLHELEWSGPVAEMVKVAWALFNGGRFGEPGEQGEPPITAPRFEEVVSRLDLDNFVAVLDAMRLRKGFYGPPAPSATRTDAQIEEDAERQVAHDRVVREIRDRLVDQIRAVALSLETHVR